MQGPEPEIVLGPPGTGKTTTLIGIVADELAAGCAPNRVGYLSFTRRAAEEAVTRGAARFGLTADDLPYFRTIHSLCFRELELSSSEVLEGRRLGEFASWIDTRISGRAWTDDGTAEGFSEGDRILFMIQVARLRGRSLFDTWCDNDDGLQWYTVNKISYGLERYKKDNGLLDFTDMLELFVRRGQAPPLDVLLVDEAQDLSPLQWQVVKKLSEGCRRYVVGGDDDQAIYAWAGADASQLINMRGRVTVLGQSWRVPAAVQALAARVIEGAALRHPKTWAPRQAPGRVGGVGSVHEVDWGGEWVDDVQPVLVLARNTYVLRDLVEPELRARGVLYEWGERRAVDAAVLGAVFTWERLRAGQRANLAQVRGCYNLLRTEHLASGARSLRGIDEDDELSLADLTAHHGLMTNEVWYDAMRVPEEDVGMIVAARRRGEKLTGRPRVRLSTIHGAKGGEARHVVLMKEMAERTYREMEIRPDDERRVWYVGATRAREQLTIVDARERKRSCPWL